MKENTGRRSFLKRLGFGTAASVAAPFTLIGVDKAKPGSEQTAFRFGCDCGAYVVAKVPPNKDDVVDVACDSCKTAWRFTWKGDHFAVSQR